MLASFQYDGNHKAFLSSIQKLSDAYTNFSEPNFEFLVKLSNSE